MKQLSLTDGSEIFTKALKEALVDNKTIFDIKVKLRVRTEYYDADDSIGTDIPTYDIEYFDGRRWYSYEFVYS